MILIGAQIQTRLKLLLVMGTRIFGKDEYFTEIIQEP